MALTPVSMRLSLCLTLLVMGAAVAAFAQTNEDLYRSGQIGLANGNCVKAARFWFAYLVRQPTELAANPTRKARLEETIRRCDEEPDRYAATYVTYTNKIRTKEGKCQVYSEVAVAQFEASRLASCNLTGTRWQPDYSFHYNWCVAVDDDQAFTERRARDQALSSCGAGRSAVLLL